MTTPKSRKNPRAQVTLLARYRSPTAFEYVEERCFDLSSGGMFIESTSPAPAGTLIKLECEVNEGMGTLRGVARVVWLREQHSDGQPPGMGVKFLKLEPGSRELIMQVLGERASLPPTDSIPASRKSWAPSVAPQARASSMPAAKTSQVPPLPPRPSGAAPLAAAPADAAGHQEVEPSELTEVAPSALPAVVARSQAPSAVGAAVAASDAVSGAVSVDAAMSAVLAAEAVLAPAGVGSAHGAKDADAGLAAHHDHRPHAHELRERLARRAAAQRAAAGAHAETSDVGASTATDPLAATAASAAAAAPTATWTEPARGAETAPAKTESKPAAAKAESKPAPAKAESKPAPAAAGTNRQAAAAAAGKAAPAAKAPTPAAQAEKGRGGIYVALIAAAVIAFLLLRGRGAEEPAATTEAPPVTAVTEPAPAVEPPPAAAPTPPEAPPAAVTPYVIEVATTPDGATLEVAGQSATSPAKLALGALTGPVTLRAHKEGFEPATLELDLAGFALVDGEQRRSVTLALTALPPPPPPPPPTPKPAPVVAKAPKPPPADTPKKPAVEKPKPAAEPVAVAPAPAPAAAPAPTPAPAAAPVAPAQSPLQVAMACLATGDNACVLRALEGKTSNARELELLIETHRTMGHADKAEQLMQSYVDKYPSERRATTFMRQLERKAGAPASPVEGAAPAP